MCPVFRNPVDREAPRGAGPVMISQCTDVSAEREMVSDVLLLLSPCRGDVSGRAQSIAGSMQPRSRPVPDRIASKFLTPGR